MTEPVLVSDLLFATWQSHPDTPALGVAGEWSYSYRKVAALADRLAGRLTANGIQAGDRVAIVAENQPNWGVAYLAINRCGAIAVPVLPDFPAGDVARILDHAQIAACFVSKRLIAKASEAGLADSSATVYLLDNLERLDGITDEKVEQSLEALPHASPPDDAPRSENRHPGESDDVAAIIYTSGTTGNSKGVVLTNRNLMVNVLGTRGIPGIRTGDSMLSILPLAHTYECTIGFLIPISMGCSVYYLTRPPSATVLMPALDRVRPHLMLSVPLLIEKLYRQSILPSLTGKSISKRLYGTRIGRKLLNRIAGRKLRRVFGGRLYFFGIGGAAIAPEVEDFLIEARFPYAVGYGLTETAPLIAGANNRDMRPRSTGFPIPGIEVRITNPDRETGEGEIIVRGPTVMRGYYKDPERTAEVIDADGWFHTGDLGSFDDDGRLYIRGRVKNMILGPSGENIFPEAIEALINSYEFVEDSVVFQYQGGLTARVHVNYEALRERAQAVAEAASGIPGSIGDFLSDLRKSVNERLAAFSRISEVIEQEEPFEKTPTNKIKRFLYDSLHRQQPEDKQDSAESGDQGQ